MINNRKVILSGNRPTGRLHIGHLFGVLENWAKLQDDYETYFEVADWHALTTKYKETGSLKKDIEDMVIDWLVAGISPERSVIFVQSHVKQHAELHILFSMLVSLSRLLRNPTLKEYIAERETLKLKTEKKTLSKIAASITEKVLNENEERREVLEGKIKEFILSELLENLFSEDTEVPYGDIVNYGFLGYPVLQAADILIYRAHVVPIGKDQLPHLELTREIARRFNSLYGEVFPVPEPILNEFAKVPGTDGRKMSKSYGNTILIGEDSESLKKKIMSSYTDPQKIHKNDPGHPDTCPIFQYHLIFNRENADSIKDECVKGIRGCVQCKKEIFAKMDEFMEPYREKRAKFEEKRDLVWDIIKEGDEKARTKAEETMQIVREKMRINY